MQAPKDLLRATTITTMELSEVLSPESFVFVALMDMEEGPNKASILPIASTLMKCVEEEGGTVISDLLII